MEHYRNFQKFWFLYILNVIWENTYKNKNIC